jgi:hypothetical protein
VIAESLLLKHQLIVLNRARNRAPRLTPWDRLLFGIAAFWVAPNRLPKIAIGIRPSTLLRVHRALIQRKYRLLFKDFDDSMFSAIASYLALRTSEPDARRMAKIFVPSDKLALSTDRIKQTEKYNGWFYSEGMRKPKLIKLNQFS